jgi:phospholipid/cholesterol/gamma-HCH transport system substrate-binding protein
MENKSHALTAGLFTLLLLAAAIWVALWFTRDDTAYEPYKLATDQSIPGLYPQADVRYRGLDVGWVEDITFDPKVPGQILIHIRVRPDTPITHSTYGTLGYQGVTGIAYVELNDEGNKPIPLPTSEEDVARIPIRPGILNALENRGQVILEQVEQLTKRLNQFMNDENQEAIITAFNNVSEAAKSLQSIPQQLQPTLKGLQPSLERLPRVMTEAEKSLASLTELTRDLNSLANNLDDPDGAIEQFSEAAERIRSVAEELEREAVPLATDARRTLRNVDRTLENFNNGSGLLFGPRGPGRPPGPGEEGFLAPAE